MDCEHISEADFDYNIGSGKQMDEKQVISGRKRSEDRLKEGIARASSSKSTTKSPKNAKKDSEDDKLIAPFGDIPKVIKDGCNEHPSITVNSAASKPYVGIYIVSDKHYVWMEKPKNILTHPEWEQTVEMLPKPTIATNMAPWDSFFLSNRAFYFYKNSNLYKFTKIPRVAEDVKQIDAKNLLPLTQLPKDAKINAAFEALAGIDDFGDSYFVVLYTLNGKQEILMTKGNSTKKVPVSYTWTGKPVTAIGLFDYRAMVKDRLGFVAFGKHFQYFQLLIGETNANLKIVSPPMDNQVLFGCPQTFCFHSAIDAITTRNQKILVIRGIYYWELDKILTSLTKSNSFLLTNIKTQDDINPFLTSTVEAAFVATNIVYIIKKGRIYMEDAPGYVLRWRPYDTMFTNMQDADWFGPMDAAFRSPSNPNNSFLIKGMPYSEQTSNHNVDYEGDKYWYLTREDSGDFTSLRQYHISHLKGFPSFIEAAFYYEPDSKVYAFSGNYLFIIDKNDFAEGFTTQNCQVKLVQDVFFGCGQYAYEKTSVYKSFTDFKAQMTNYKPQAAPKEADYIWVYTGVISAFLILIIIGIVVIYLLLRSKPPTAVGADTGSRESLEAVPVTPKASGISVGEELQEVIKEKKARRGESPLKNKSLQLGTGGSKLAAGSLTGGSRLTAKKSVAKIRKK